MSDKGYRFGVVGVFIDDQQNVLTCQRSNQPGAWQFPQGGIDDGEDPVSAIIREVSEELGTTHVEILKAAEGLTTYDFPLDATFPIAKSFRGQQHHWFLLKFKGSAAPNLAASDGEFNACQWVQISDCLASVAPWKKDAYLQGLKLLGLIK